MGRLFTLTTMSLGEALSTFFRDFAAALGFIALIEVSLVAADVTVSDGIVQVDVVVHDGLTEDLRRLIESSNPVTVRYAAILYYGAAGRREISVAKTVTYDGLADSYRVAHGRDERHYASLEPALADLFLFCISERIDDPRLLLAEAELELPDVEQVFVDRIWGTPGPSLRHRF